MKRRLLTAPLVLLLVPMAFADVELRLVSGGLSVDFDGMGGVAQYGFSNGHPPPLNGWEIEAAIGTSSSPSDLPVGLQLTIIAECFFPLRCATSPLQVWLSDTGFTSPTGGFFSFYNSIAQTGATATTSQKAWVGLNDDYFGADGTNGSAADGSLIGTIGPLSSPGSSGGVNFGGPSAGALPYSLTVEDTFRAGRSTGETSSCNGPPYAACFETFGSVDAVPEPAALVLLGSVVIFCSLRLRRAAKSR